MRIIECDRCHKRFNKDAKKTGFICLDTQDVETGDLGGNNDFDGWDLCEDCVQRIRDFVRMVPPMGEKPKEEKPKATIKKPVTGTALTQEKIDLIKQMARDGKTVKEICDYTGVSDERHATGAVSMNGARLAVSKNVDRCITFLSINGYVTRTARS